MAKNVKENGKKVREGNNQGCHLVQVHQVLFGKGHAI